MKVWSVQKESVVEYVMQQGFYQPDFAKSDYLASLSLDLQPLYYFLLEVFNRRNQLDLPGLVFGFAGSDNRRVFEIQDISEFFQVIQNGGAAIESLWRTLKRRGGVILELDYDPFDPILIDINDYQYLMPPITPMPPYRPQHVAHLLNNLRSGVIEPSPLPSGIIQTHTPWISRENVTGIYQMFDLS